jgi:hypothetical protein
MSDEPKDKPEYEIGWGKPPQHTHFRKGRSGNPKGRFPGTRNLKTDLTNELGGRIRVREGDREILISKQEAFLKSLVARALKGDARASALLVTMMAKLLDVSSAPPSTEVAAGEQAIIDAYFSRRFAQATIPKANGAALEGPPGVGPQYDAKANTGTESDPQVQDQSMTSNASTKEA